MYNYLTAATFQENEHMIGALVKAKLAFDQKEWNKVRIRVFVDEDNLTIWSDSDSSAVNELFHWIDINIDATTIDEGTDDEQYIEVEFSKVNLSAYAEDICDEYEVNDLIANSIGFPALEFEHDLYNGDLETYMREYAQGEAA